MHNIFNLSSAVKQKVNHTGVVTLVLFAYLSLINTVQANTIDKKVVKKHIIYLVRHAEKLKEDKDPALTACGLQRANALAKQLSMVKFTDVFSTEYKRTVSTAKPTAEQNKIEISYYDPKKLKLLAEKVSREEGISLIVGHSNTTAVLAGLLAQQELSSFDESIYDRLYQVVIINGHVNLQLLMQNFECTMDPTK